MSQSLYDVLGLSQKADDEQIKAAYRLACKRFHPDSKPGFEVEFRSAQKAYDVLSDPVQRARYDQTLSRKETPNPQTSPEQDASKTHTATPQNHSYAQDYSSWTSRVGRLEFSAPSGPAWDELSPAQHKVFFKHRFSFPAEIPYDIDFERRSKDVLKKYVNTIYTQEWVDHFGPTLAAIWTWDAENLQEALLRDCRQVRMREMGFSTLKELHDYDDTIFAERRKEQRAAEKEREAQAKAQKSAARAAKARSFMSGLVTVASIVFFFGMAVSRPGSETYMEALKVIQDRGIFDSESSFLTLGGLLPLSIASTAFFAVVSGTLALNWIASLIVLRRISEAKSKVAVATHGTILALLAPLALALSAPALVVLTALAVKVLIAAVTLGGIALFLYVLFR